MPAARERIVARSAVAGPASTSSLSERDGLGSVMGRASRDGGQGNAGAARPLRPGSRAPSRPASNSGRRNTRRRSEAEAADA